MSKTKFLLTNISLLLFTLVVVFAVAEICARAFYDESENFARYRWEELQNPDMHRYGTAVYANPQNGLIYKDSNNKILENNYIRFNQVKKSITEKNKYRIVTLGDSFTACAGVRDKNDCYTWQLERILNEKAEEFKNIEEFEVLPIGAGCLNTFQELQLLKEIGLSYNPDAIVLQYCPNDISPNCMPLRKIDEGGVGIMGKANFLYLYKKNRTIIVPSLASLVPHISLFKNLEEFLLKHSSFVRFISYKLNTYMVKLESDPEKSYRSVKEIGQIAKEKNIPFLTMATPSSFHDTNSYNGLKVILENVESSCKRTGGRFHVSANSLKELKQIKSELDGSHYNALGNRIMAETLSQDIIDHIKKNKN